MPDSIPPDWTPDEAFWDEAWKDMNDRLDRRRRRKRLFWALPLALLLAVGAGTLVVTSPGAATAAETVPEQRAAEATIPRQPPALGQADRPAGGNKASELQTPVGPTPGSGVLAKSVTNTAATTAIPEPRRSSPGEFSPAAPPAMAAAVALVDVLPPQPLTLIELTLPPLRPRAMSPVRDRRRLFVEVGGSSYLPLPQAGGFAALGYALRAGRWQVPLMLRYDVGRRTVHDELREGAPTPVLDYTLGNNFSPVQVPPPITFDNRLQLHQLELRTGLARALGGGQRLRVSGGGGVAYLLGGQGPDRAATLPTTGARYTQGYNPLAYRYSPDPLVPAVAEANRADLSVDRLDFTLWAGLGYAFAPRWQFRAGVTHYLTPLYRSETLSVDRTRVDVGLRLGF